MGKQWKQWQTLFSWGSKIIADGDCDHEIKRCLFFEKRAMTNLDSILKNRDITLLTKICIVKAIAFIVIMYRCGSWTIKKAEHQRLAAFELWCWRRLSGSPLDCKEIKPVNPKGNKTWIFIGRTDSEVEAPVLWPSDAMSWLIGKDSDAEKDWRQEERGMPKEEMIGWHHWLNGRGFEQAPGDSEGQGSLACCSPWGCKELDTTEQLINNKYGP